MYRDYLGPETQFGVGRWWTTAIQDLAVRNINFTGGTSLGFATIITAARQFLLLADRKYKTARILGKKFITFYKRLEAELRTAGFLVELL